MILYFEKKLNKCSGRLYLLRKIRHHLTVHAAKSIYASMILPTFTYCGLVNLSWNKGEIEKLRRIEYWSNCIVKSSSRNAELELTSFTDAIRKRASVSTNVLAVNICQIYLIAILHRIQEIICFM